jgi:hypothetical protein
MPNESHLARLLGAFDRPWHWLVFSAVCVGLDYLAGPYTQFPVAFGVPVALAAWHRGQRWSISLSIVLSAAHLVLNLIKHPAPPLFEALANNFIFAAGLAVLALLVDVVRHQLDHLEQEVHTLTGLLPICMHCNKIRDDLGEWQRLERYISDHSDASFSHGLCPTCDKIHYPDVEAE